MRSNRMDEALYGKKYSFFDVKADSTCGCNGHDNVAGVDTKACWQTLLSKEAFINGLPDNSEERKLFEKVVSDSVSYLIVNNRGMFEEYVDMDGSGRYSKLSEHKISKQQTEQTISFEQKNNQLYLNGKKLAAFSQFGRFGDVVVHDVFRVFGFSCCSACHAVHSALDIHQLDCLCCLASCGFGCHVQFSISWEIF